MDMAEGAWNAIEEAGLRWPEIVVTFVIGIVMGVSTTTIIVYDRDPDSTAWSPSLRDITLGNGFINSRILLVLRAIMCAYAVGILTADCVQNSVFWEFIFFTRWNYMLLVLYLTLALSLGLWGQMHERFTYDQVTPGPGGPRESFPPHPPVRSLRAAISVPYMASPRYVERVHTPDPWEHGAGGKDEEDWIGAWGYIYRVLHEIVPVMCVVVSAVFWAVNYPSDVAAHKHVAEDISFLSINEHGISLVLCLVEIAFVTVPFCYHHVCLVLLWACAYGVFQLLFYSVGGFWVYNFMDATKPSALLWYIGLCAFHAAVFLLACVMANFCRPHATKRGEAALADAGNGDARYIIGA